MNNKKGLISVIIPSYNYARFITDTVQSLQAQSYKRWEAIVIDDHSSDDTESVVKSLMKKESRLFYERHSVNMGLPATRNTGLRQAKGEFILFLDADDIISPEKLSLHIKHFDSDENIDVSYSNCYFFRTGHHEDRYLSRNLTYDNSVFSLSGGKEILFPAFLRDNMVTVLAPLVKATLIQEVGYFNENLRQKEDWNFWIRCILANAKFFHLNNEKAYGLIRVHGESLLDNKVQALSYTDHFYAALENILFQKPEIYNSEIKIFESFMRKRKVRELIKKMFKTLGIMKFMRDLNQVLLKIRRKTSRI